MLPESGKGKFSYRNGDGDNDDGGGIIESAVRTKPRGS